MTDLAQIRNVFLANVQSFEIALRGDTSGFVHVWPKYWIGVKFNKDVCHGVNVDAATVTHRSDKRYFKNGHGERTVLMSRREALEKALVNARQILADFDARTTQAA